MSYHSGSQPPSPNAPFGAGQPQPADTGNARPVLADTIAIASELWLVVVVCQIISYIGEFSAGRDAMRRAAGDVSGEQAELLNSTAFMVTVWTISGVIVAAVCLAVVWFTRRGYMWARLVLVVFSVYVVFGAAIALFSSSRTSWTTIPDVIGGVAALGAVYLLAKRDSDAYCRDMTRWRRARRSPEPSWQAMYPYPPQQYQQYPGQPPNPHQPPNPYGHGQHDNQQPWYPAPPPTYPAPPDGDTYRSGAYTPDAYPPAEHAPTGDIADDARQAGDHGQSAGGPNGGQSAGGPNEDRR